MAQFTVADVPGAFARGQQFRQQEQLRPIQLDAARQALQSQQNQFARQQQLAPLQFQSAQLGVQQQQQDLNRDAELKALTDNVISASALKAVPNEGKAAFLMNKIKRGEAQGRDMTQSKSALQLVRDGRFDELAQGTEQLLQVAQQFGISQEPAGARTKPTASAQDFQTFKQLTAKAQKTQDPIDIQLAEQFGRQSGFDRETPQELADIEVSKESKKALVKQAATASKEAFDSLKGVRKTIANIDDAVKALDSGADTGPIVSKLPSFRQAAIELDNIKGRMGLDVVGATTFGALSESELAFALNVALPDSLEPVALKDWLIKKKDAQTKLSNELRKAASFLGKPGNTIADYIDQQEKENPSVANLSDEDLFN